MQTISGKGSTNKAAGWTVDWVDCGAVVLRTCGKGRDLAPGPCPSPTGQHYLELGQLLAVVEDAEGVEVVRARVWDHLTAHQAEGLLGRLAPVPVLVEVQVTVPDRAPA